MDDAARGAAVDRLVRDSNAVRQSIEIVRQKRSGDRETVLARWTEVTGRVRRGAVDVVMEDGIWRAVGGWSSNANHDSDNAVWDAWGGSGQSMSGWLSDPAAATVCFRQADGSRVEADTVEDRAAILIYETDADRGSAIEILDTDATVLSTAPIT
jgi:hypothetical protein